MKSLLIFVLLLSNAFFAIAQTVHSTSAETETSGEIIESVYKNSYFDLTFPLPEGFYDAGRDVPASGKLLFGMTYFLFVADRHTGGPTRDRILLMADDSRQYRPSMNAAQYLENLVRAQKSSPGMSSTREPTRVELAGEHYVRADYTRTESGQTLYNSMIVAKVRDHWLYWTFVSASADDLERDIASLARITYGKYQTEPTDPKPTCVPSATATPRRIHVSQSFAETLLLKRVEPDYPQEAMADRTPKRVVLRLLIDENGGVKQTDYVAGDMLLKTSAMDAVSKWRFRPYELNCTPIQIETQFSIPFTLTPKAPS